jgi:hypothetical protein
MNAASELDGARIAKAVSATAEATDVLRRTQRPSVVWFFVMVGSGFVLSASLASVFASTQWLVATGAGAGFTLAMLAHLECLRLHRRLNAALVLLGARNEGF